MASEVVYQSGEVQVIAFNVDHTPIFPAVGYRVNYKDRSVVISGDTVYTESLTYHTMGADVFVSEALNDEFSQMWRMPGKTSITIHQRLRPISRITISHRVKQGSLPRGCRSIESRDHPCAPPGAFCHSGQAILAGSPGEF